MWSIKGFTKWKPTFTWSGGFGSKQARFPSMVLELVTANSMLVRGFISMKFQRIRVSLSIRFRRIGNREEKRKSDQTHAAIDGRSFVLWYLRLSSIRALPCVISREFSWILRYNLYVSPFVSYRHTYIIIVIISSCKSIDLGNIESGVQCAVCGSRV